MSRINQPIEAVDLQIYFSILFKTGKPFFSIARFTTQILVIMSTIARLCCFVIKIRRNWKKYRACVWYFIRSCFKCTLLFNVCTNIPRHYSAEHWAVVRSIIIPGLERYSRRKRERESSPAHFHLFIYSRLQQQCIIEEKGPQAGALWFQWLWLSPLICGEERFLQHILSPLQGGVRYTAKRKTITLILCFHSTKLQPKQKHFWVYLLTGLCSEAMYFFERMKCYIYYRLQKLFLIKLRPQSFHQALWDNQENT